MPTSGWAVRMAKNCSSVTKGSLTTSKSLMIMPSTTAKR